MMCDEARAQRAAALLWERWQANLPGGLLPEDVRPADFAEGWAVQRALTELAGPSIGWKVAASSPSGQRHIGVSGPIAGPLVASGVRCSGADVPRTSMASVEPEFAFRIGVDLPATGWPYPRETILAAVTETLPAIEIPDSRFTHASEVGEAHLVADLACAAYVVLGEPVQKWTFSDLKDRQVITRINGDTVAVGFGANALGDPCDSLAWLVNTVTGQGTPILAGAVMITGAAASPHPVKSGDIVSCEIDGAPPVTTTIE